jgi:6-phosphogluconolactonase
LLGYIGTYSGPHSKGIYLSRFDLQTGNLTPAELAAETKSPSFLAIHPSRKFLYAVGEIDTFEGKKSGAVSAFSLDPDTGKLTLLNQQSSGGPGPCHLAVDRSGKCVLVANLLAMPPRDRCRWTLSLRPPSSSTGLERQSAATGGNALARLYFFNRLAMVCDLGLTRCYLSTRPRSRFLIAHDPPSDAGTAVARDTSRFIPAAGSPISSTK